ncbi:hypothetical protein PQE70_gp094 [Bacillus phage vB_BanS_Nate]|uniref:Uncharacterized protein n=1 Tax=Bacillus phage vB_BanS_Nate TaxID=2894788 RepID=A0AAE8YUP9_9CAUD|nr:hypothetical protein PQE70_gp094 [Bacillus phage vB_BanS_Nate]UGO50947.1 hypothetical protein NATE_94 [Bacillus phage vB_BanS_Nate]
MAQKFELGEIVFVKTDLKAGYLYQNEVRTKGTYVSKSHRKYAGHFGIVQAYVRGGYELRFGKDYDMNSIYYDEMLDKFVDTLKDGDSVTKDTERLIRNLEIHNIQRCIDNALTNRMFNTDREGFNKLVDTYNELSKR